MRKLILNIVATVLGFINEKYIENSTSEKCLNISNMISVNLICDLIEGIYEDGKITFCNI